MQKGLFKYVQMASSWSGLRSGVVSENSSKFAKGYSECFALPWRYFDNWKAHLQNLEAVLSHLENVGMHIKFNKCHLMQKSLQYLSHTCHSGEKVAAISKENGS